MDEKKAKLASSIVSAVGGVSSLINGAMEQSTDVNNRYNAIQNNIDAQQNAYNSIGSNSTDELMSQINSLGTLENISYKDLLSSKGQAASNIIGSGLSGAGAGAMFGGIGAAVGAGTGLLSGIFGRIAAKRRAKRRANEYNALAEYTREQTDNSIDNAIENQRMNQMLFANTAAYGGPINMNYTGFLSPFGNRFADGGIYIKPSKRGTFTAAATKHGKSVQEFASQVLANKENYSPAMVKKANFARNAANWHAFGGNLFNDFNNGIDVINNGGSHESNPYGGVMVGTDQNGVPNLVEEGEVIYNDYVFSKRMKLPKELKERFKLKKDSTYADAAKTVNKESEERPLDPISTRGKNAMLGILAQSQEVQRAKKNERNGGNVFAKGGNKNKGKDISPLLPFQATADWENYHFIDPPLSSRLDLSAPVNNNIFLNSIKSIKDDVSNPRKSLRRFDIPDYKSVKLTDSNNQLPTSMRYAPAIGSAIGAIQSLFSKPNYSEADMILNAAKNASQYTPIEGSYLGDYLEYSPIDTNYIANQIRQQGNRGISAINTTSGGNRATAMTNLIAQNAATQNALGDAYIKAVEQNMANKARVAEFNRGTNQANAAMRTDVAKQNQQALMNARNAWMNGIMQAAQLREKERMLREQSVSSNLSQLFANIGNIGRENFFMNQRNWAINRGIFGPGVNP